MDPIRIMTKIFSHVLFKWAITRDFVFCVFFMGEEKRSDHIFEELELESCNQVDKQDVFIQVKVK